MLIYYNTNTDIYHCINKTKSGATSVECHLVLPAIDHAGTHEFTHLRQHFGDLHVVGVNGDQGCRTVLLPANDDGGALAVVYISTQQRFGQQSVVLSLAIIESLNGLCQFQDQFSGRHVVLR